MKLQKKLTALLSVSMVILLVVSPRTFAGPDLPSVSGPVANFTGDQSDGIWPSFSIFPPLIWTCPPVYTYNVYDLTTDITPASGVEGILLQYQGPNGGNGSDAYGWSVGGAGGAGAGVARPGRVHGLEQQPRSHALPGPALPGLPHRPRPFRRDQDPALYRVLY